MPHELTHKPDPVYPTNDQVEQLYLAIEDGLFLNRACVYAGINPRVVYSWIETARFSDNPDLPEVVFTQQLAQAMAQAELNALRNVRRGGANWRGEAWFLERRFSGTWDLESRVPQDEQTLARERDRVRLVLTDVIDALPDLTPEQRAVAQRRVEAGMQELSTPDALA